MRREGTKLLKHLVILAGLTALLSCASAPSLPGDRPSPGSVCTDAACRIQAMDDEELDRAIARVESCLNDGGKMRTLGCRVPLRLGELYLELADRQSAQPGKRDLAAHTRKVAVNFLSLTIKQYPSCPQIPRAHLLLGEYYFNQNNVFKASAAYEQVLRFPDSFEAPFARYKLAWCHYNLTKYEKALEGFMKTVLFSRDGCPDKPSCITLGREALKDSLFAYAEVGQPHLAPKFYRMLAPKSWEKLCEKLAQLYADRGQERERQRLLDALDKSRGEED